MMTHIVGATAQRAQLKGITLTDAVIPVLNVGCDDPGAPRYLQVRTARRVVVPYKYCYLNSALLLSYVHWAVASTFDLFNKMWKFFLKSTLLLLCLSLLAVPLAQANQGWPAWQQFKQDYISDQGRVIDPSHPQKVTTSEGQSYALFFSLAANDKAAFELILNWTQNNLAQGELSARLPAWQWGQTSSSQWEVIDANSASDADLWIAYSLLEAGRLWSDKHYQTLGHSLLERIKNEEVVNIPHLGEMLLPGKQGFDKDHCWKLNPSYQPPQLLMRFATIDPIWHKVSQTNNRLLMETTPKGFVPDWVLWCQHNGWQQPKPEGDLGSYDAIRVYLWLGMLPDTTPDKAKLMSKLRPMRDWVEQHGMPPEQVHTSTGMTINQGPVGFSAALLPFLQDSSALNAQRQRIIEQLPGDSTYYSAVLTLFGTGWDQQLYRFNHNGELLPIWSNECDDCR